MPTYQYECSACNHQFEILQSMMDKRLRKCPKCNKNKLDRLIGAGAGIIFKGSGFYETDYKKKTASSNEGNKIETKKDKSAKAESSGDTSGDSCSPSPSCEGCPMHK